MFTVRRMETTPAIIERFYELIETGDVDRLVMLYAANGEIIRYDGVAASSDEIRGYYRDYLARHPGSTLRQIDKIQSAGDVLMWDALVDSDAGLRQTIDVVILDDDGLIRRHIPGFRGYWGR